MTRSPNAKLRSQNSNSTRNTQAWNLYQLLFSCLTLKGLHLHLQPQCQALALYIALSGTLARIQGWITLLYLTSQCPSDPSGSEISSQVLLTQLSTCACSRLSHGQWHCHGPGSLAQLFLTCSNAYVFTRNMDKLRDNLKCKYTLYSKQHNDTY